MAKPTNSPAPLPAEVPLIVDLDGTLIRTDMLWESFVRLLRRNPLYAFAALVWWARGRAYLKRQLAQRIRVNPGGLPFHEPFLEFLRSEKAKGRKIILATASDVQMARPVADQAAVFDEVLASDGKHNLRGSRKGYVLCERYGERGFDYAGNSSVDLAVWEKARRAIVVNASPSLVQRAAKIGKVGSTFLESQRFFWWMLQEVRVQRWPKNALVLLPLLALKAPDAGQVASAQWASITFCLCAGGAYVWNDLMDLDEDRGHSVRRGRPFASGRLPLVAGLVIGPLLATAGLVLGAWQSWNIAAVLSAYLIGSVVYTTVLKGAVLLAIAGLTSLNLLRIVAGGLAVGWNGSWSQLGVSFALCACLATVRFAFHRK